jgi:hypothetical protein
MRASLQCGEPFLTVACACTSRIRPRRARARFEVLVKTVRRPQMKDTIDRRGGLTATALVAAVGDRSSFKNGSFASLPGPLSFSQPTSRSTQQPYRSVAASPHRHSPRPNSVPAPAKQRAAGPSPLLRAYKPLAAAIEAIPNLKSLWRAKSTEDLEIALDKAQSTILEALQSSDPQTRLNAASLMLRSRQARERGWS